MYSWIDWPDWGDVLDLNLINVSWTLPFLVGTICTAIHLAWTWQRWRATVELKKPDSVQTAAFWFFRQDALNVILGVAMTAAGALAMLRFQTVHIVMCLLVGAVAFMINKVWNLIDDARVQFFVQNGRSLNEYRRR